VLFGEKSAAHQEFLIPLADCVECRRSARVLPIELLPYKTFGLEVITKSIGSFIFSDRSYRQSVRGIVAPVEHGPSHSTLHRWITGFSEKLLERTPAISRRYPPASTAAIAQTERTFSTDVSKRVLHCAIAIDPRKFRSERRHDQLSAIARLLVVAIALFGAIRSCLIEWNRLLLPVFYVPVWSFPTGIPRSPMQQPRPP
jgi:hypothetical protein